MLRRILPPFAALALAACGEAQPPRHLAIPGADAEAGRALVLAYGCGACHVIPGVPGARGQVGPALTDFAQRATLAGQFPNVPRYLAPWIVDPPAMIPETGMPAMAVSQEEARHMAAYLYTLGARNAHVHPAEDRPLAEAGRNRALIEANRARLETPALGAAMPIDEAMRILAGEP